MTEAEILRNFKAQPMELGLKAIAAVSEENKNISLYPVGLDGLEPSVVATIRKMRLFQETAVYHHELLLQPLHQIDAKQGQEVYEHVTSHQVKHRDGSLKVQGKLLTARQLLKLGLEIEEKKQSAMDSLSGAGLPAGEDDGDEEGEFGFNVQLKQPVVVAAPTAASMLGSLGPGASEKGTKRRRATKAVGGRKKGQGDDSDDESLGVDGMSEAAASMGMDLATLAQRDSDMAKVMAKHASIKGRSYGCFAVLSVSAFLRNYKHGKALQGVAWY